MAKAVSIECLACSKLSFRGIEGRHLRNNLKCYNKDQCHRKRSYYRRLEHYRAMARKNHRYIKYRGDRCAMCPSQENLTAHHIIPQSKSGLDARFNILTLCGKCHRFISNYYKIIGWVK